MRDTTRARLSAMCSALLTGESRKSIAARFGVTEKHLSRLLCTPEGKELLSRLKHQLTDAMIAALAYRLSPPADPGIKAFGILTKLFPKNMRQNAEKVRHKGTK